MSFSRKQGNKVLLWFSARKKTSLPEDWSRWSLLSEMRENFSNQHSFVASDGNPSWNTLNQKRGYWVIKKERQEWGKTQGWLEAGIHQSAGISFNLLPILLPSFLSAYWLALFFLHIISPCAGVFKPSDSYQLSNHMKQIFPVSFRLEGQTQIYQPDQNF